MYFKSYVKKIAQEIIEKEKGNDAIELETIYQYDTLILQATKAKNYTKIKNADIHDLLEKYSEDDAHYFDLWIIGDHVLEEIDNQLNW